MSKNRFWTKLTAAAVVKAACSRQNQTQQASTILLYEWCFGWKSAIETLSSNILQQASYSYDVTNSVLIDICLIYTPSIFISRSPLQFEKNNICLDWKRFTVVVKQWSVWPGIIFGLWRPGDRPPPSHCRHQQQLSSGHRATIVWR